MKVIPWFFTLSFFFGIFTFFRIFIWLINTKADHFAAKSSGHFANDTSKHKRPGSYPETFGTEKFYIFGISNGHSSAYTHTGIGSKR